MLFDTESHLIGDSDPIPLGTRAAPTPKTLNHRNGLRTADELSAEMWQASHKQPACQ